MQEITRDVKGRLSYRGAMIYNEHADCVFHVSRVQSTDHTGTAFLCYSNKTFALFMTCWHVSTGLRDLQVTMKSPKNENVEVVGCVLDSLEPEDISIIVVKYDGLSESARTIIKSVQVPVMKRYHNMCQPVWVLSYDEPDKGIQVNSGIITGVEIGDHDRYSTDAIVSAGHSGAPVFNKLGKVIGMAVESELGPNRMSSDVVHPADLVSMRNRAIERMTGVQIDTSSSSSEEL